jgi:hypothetical protein
MVRHMAGWRRPLSFAVRGHSCSRGWLLLPDPCEWGGDCNYSPALRLLGVNVGRSFEYYWNRGLAAFFVLVVVPFFVVTYSIGTPEMMMSSLALIAPLAFVATVTGLCNLAGQAKGKGP